MVPQVLLGATPEHWTKNSPDILLDVALRQKANKNKIVYKHSLNVFMLEWDLNDRVSCAKP